MTNDPEKSRTRYQTTSITRRRGVCEPVCHRIGADSCFLDFVWRLVNAALWPLLSDPGADMSKLLSDRWADVSKADEGRAPP